MSSPPNRALRRLPPEMHERARAFADGLIPAPEPRHAATVVLLRDAPDHGVEAYLLHRHGTMAFAGGMWVFPGGSVDPRDRDADTPWTGPRPAEWTAPLSADEPLARALVAAAVRETFEECGVLLAGRTPDSVEAVDADTEHWSAEQMRLLVREASISEVLAANGLTLRADLLRPWAHWVTPEFEPKRFDTRFFVAALPVGQQPVHFRGEAAASEWIRPADAVMRHAERELNMLPPTVVTLAELAEYPSVEAVLDAGRRRDIRMMLPRAVTTGDDVFVLLPGDEGYPE